MKRGLIFLFVVGIIFSISFISSAPQINFANPTPDSGNITEDANVEINVSIIDSALSSFVFNWNQSNFTIFNDSLVLYMNFDNRSLLGENDTYVADISNRQNNGIVLGAASFNTSGGKYNGAFEFDGSDDYILIQNSSSLNTTSQVTVAVWVYTKSLIGSTQTEGAIFEKTIAGQSNKQYQLIADGSTWFFRIYDGGIGRSSVSTPVLLNSWHHLAGTYDGSKIHFYLDGSEIGSGANYVGNIDGGEGESYVGILIGAPTRFIHNGSIDELMVFNRSLSSNEIRQVYFSTLSKIDTDKYNFYSNQQSLENANYSYQAFATDSSDSQNQTELRYVVVSLPGILISFPSIYTLFQRHNSTSGQIKIFGTYTGLPTSIEANFNNSGWTEINNSILNNFYLGYFNASVGTGNLSVRFSNNHSTNYTVENTSLLEIYMLLQDNQMQKEGELVPNH